MGHLDVVRRVARASAFVVALATVALAASCRDVVTDDVVDAQAALCSSFEACDVEARACKRVSAFFGSQSDDVYGDYLEHYVEWRCGESCGAVDVCLDFDLLCEAPRASCNEDFECCNASTGAAACKGGQCCYDLGVVCDGPEDCCPFDDGTQVGCFTRQEGAPPTCGGLEACQLRDEECEDDEDCCGKAGKVQCLSGTCQTDTCVERDDPCRGSEECCVDGDACRDGTCGPPDGECDEPAELLEPPCCVDVDAACTIGGPGCCGGAICLAGVENEGVCRPPNSCGPPGTICEIDEDCCSNGTDAIGCVAVKPDGTGTRICGPIGCQLELDAPCGANGLSCCTGLSCRPSEPGDEVATRCKEACSEPGCHDIQEFGGPLRLDCEFPSMQQAECARQICTDDPFCCCYGWTEYCVMAAAACLGPDPEGVPPDGSPATERE